MAMLGLIDAGGTFGWTLAGAPLVIVPGLRAFPRVSVPRRLVDREGDAS